MPESAITAGAWWAGTTIARSYVELAPVRCAQDPVVRVVVLELESSFEGTPRCSRNRPKPSTISGPKVSIGRCQVWKTEISVRSDTSRCSAR